MAAIGGRLGEVGRGKNAVGVVETGQELRPADEAFALFSAR